MGMSVDGGIPGKCRSAGPGEQRQLSRSLTEDTEDTEEGSLFRFSPRKPRSLHRSGEIRLFVPPSVRVRSASGKVCSPLRITGMLHERSLCAVALRAAQRGSVPEPRMREE